MAFAFFIIFLFGLLVALCTLATVLLIRLFTKSFSLDQRSIAAAVIGPVWLLAPLIVALIAGGQIREFESQILLALFVGGSFAISWLTSYFATRRLERVTRFDPQIFE